MPISILIIFHSSKTIHNHTLHQLLRFIFICSALLCSALYSCIRYMRKGALVIEMRGDYYNEEFFNFHALANIFEVFYTWIVTKVPGIFTIIYYLLY